jgi:hypothetical protein
MTERYYAAACQTDFPCPTARREIGRRAQRMCDLVRETVLGYEPFFDVRLLVFPEFAHIAPIYDSVDKLLERLAIPIPMSIPTAIAESAKSWAATFRPARFWSRTRTTWAWSSIPQCWSAPPAFSRKGVGG